ncbi:hypothetical protein E5Q_01751 [Mixia osmundae IAM 14324]|uniref:P-loop containing nucleoside triphosphate hydrolase protein n=1 Tax=Mixia osmundae (strain CBS 9802 / IAM 14324 / JCM 22182 / KY 12970) TaxID=764103 RepID=G7DWZ9_MIXOS|nr:hypothetical protein E5Q_01751 [Mixia osmundae IAM 14324]
MSTTQWLLLDILVPGQSASLSDIVSQSPPLRLSRHARAGNFPDEQGANGQFAQEMLAKPTLTLAEVQHAMSDYAQPRALSVRDLHRERTKSRALSAIDVSRPSTSPFSSAGDMPLPTPRSYLGSDQDAIDIEGFYGANTPRASPLPGTAASESTPFEKAPPRYSQMPPPKTPEIAPTIKLLFALTSKREFFMLILPALICSVATGLIPTYMTTVMSKFFDAFIQYQAIQQTTSSPDAIKPAQHALLTSTLHSALIMFLLAALTLTGETVSLTLWSWNGEKIARSLRLNVYDSVTNKSMTWFDTGMCGSTNDDGEDSGEASAGLMGRFQREIDDVRMGASQNMGMLVQYLSTMLSCLILAFFRSYQLTLVILASVPLVVVLTAVTETMAEPLIGYDRDLTSAAATRAERALSAITTVKAFNAEQKEEDAFVATVDKVRSTYNRLAAVWGVRIGGSHFVLLAMFVQGFWFGHYQVSKGKITGGTVNEVFWATLLGSSNLQGCIPVLIFIEKAKVAMASLLTLIASPSERPSTVAVPFPATPQLDTTFDKAEIRVAAATPEPDALNYIPAGGKGSGHIRELKRIQPRSFSGELALHEVTFHYPARPPPADPVLTDVSLYFAPRETTYIVGGSGSGKSTVGALLLGLYEPDSGRIEADEQSTRFLDQTWLRRQIGMVSQGASVLFDGSVHDNVAIGVVGSGDRQPSDVTREEVITACRLALIHDFISDLPEGYDTWLSGAKGASLSGGQRQRLAIARASIRNPTVLILDEATSALDGTSRFLVSEAIKKWRTNQTTIVITHDLTPIAQDDFVYVMQHGKVMQEGYRRDLDKADGPFAEMMQLNALAMGAPKEEILPEIQCTPPTDDRKSLADGWRPSLYRASSAVSDWMPRVSVVNFTRRKSFVNASLSFLPDMGEATSQAQVYLSSRRASRPAFVEGDSYSSTRSPSTSPTSLAYFGGAIPRSPVGPRLGPMSVAGFENIGLSASSRRPGGRSGRPVTIFEAFKAADIAIAMDGDKPAAGPTGLISLLRVIYPTIPNKPLLFLGLFLCCVAGSMTPIFSSLLAKLIASLGAPDSTAASTTKTSLLVLLVAAADAGSQGFKFAFLQWTAMGWITAIRRKAFHLIIKQDKAYFDDPNNSLTGIVTSLVKDAEDARNLVGNIIGQIVVVVAMISFALIWALAVGWQLTLVGMAIGPIYIACLSMQTTLLSRFEAENKRKREDCAKRFHVSVSNIRALRAMSLEAVFVDKFATSVEDCYRGDSKAVIIASLGYGIANGMTYIAEGLMFYVGAVLIVRQNYTFPQMVQIFTLIVFAVTFAAQIMSFVPQLAKACQASIDLVRFLKLTEDTQESEGAMSFPIKGCIKFENVTFAYPAASHVPVLKGVNFEIQPGESVAIVGASGSGKSTIVSLLQRLYVPDEGDIMIDNRSLERISTTYLRNHLAVISQHPALFDSSISENIAYGEERLPRHDEIRAAAEAAQAHEFICALPKGYDTHLGENASLISGGQAQRIQIARALLRPREILLGDEITSALDPVSQNAVMATLKDIKVGRTTVIVTHKAAVMKTCDRVIVIDDGKVIEDGSFDDLMAKRGAFAKLASAGEWEQ